MRNLPLALAATLALSALAPTATAATVYDNGAPDPAAANFLDGFTVADDFTLGVATHIRRATAFLATADPTQIDPLLQQLSWAVYADSGNGPGALLTGAAAGHLSFSDTGLTTFFGGKVKAFTFDLGEGFDAAAGTTYWFALSAPPPFPIVFWVSAPGNGSQGSWHTEFDHPERGFQQDQAPVEHAFSLGAAVPEPASWALMIAGLGLTGATLRRRRTALLAA